jgi:predicted flap endonuclease-1-like 5' DNA nuclease
MRVVLTDGTTIACKNFKAIESGVLLTADRKRKRVVGFVPNRRLRYVLSDDYEAVEAGAGEPEPDEVAGRDVGDDGTSENGDGTDENADLDASIPDAETGTTDGTAGEEATDDSAVGGDGDLRRLGGLGATYADRLRSAGYRTLADLAAADPMAVAEAASVAPGRGRRWVDAAGRRAAPTADADAGTEAADADDEAVDDEDQRMSGHDGSENEHTDDADDGA